MRVEHEAGLIFPLNLTGILVRFSIDKAQRENTMALKTGHVVGCEGKAWHLFRPLNSSPA